MQVRALQLVTLSNGSVTESQSVLRNFSHNATSSEQHGFLEGLQEDTNYKIVIIANNVGGSNPSSFPVFIKTIQGETRIKLLLVRVLMTTSVLSNLVTRRSPGKRKRSLKCVVR